MNYENPATESNENSNIEQSAVSLLSCVAILTILCIFGIICLITISYKYRKRSTNTHRNSQQFGDGWMSICLVFGSCLSFASILPFAARVLFIINNEKGELSPVGMGPDAQLQCGAWLLSLGASFVFGAQAVLSWRRWKIQNSHFFIRLEYLASIVLLIILVDMAQLTLWHTTDPFRCKVDHANHRLLNCSIHYLPLWLLSNFLHKGVLIFTAITYSWRMQLQSTSRSMLRSVSGCSLINSSFTCVSISLLSPLICISNNWPALQHLSLSVAILLTTTSGVILHFIPNILNSLDDHQDQIVRLRHAAADHNSRQPLNDQFNSTRIGNSSSRFLNNGQKTKALVRLGASRDILCETPNHKKSCSFIDQNSSVDLAPVRETSRIEQARFSNISSVSTAPTSNNNFQSRFHQHNRRSYHNTRKHSHSPLLPNGTGGMFQNSNCISSANLKSGHLTKKEGNQARMRKSFSMNDVKQFLLHEAKVENMILDSRSPVPVLLNSSHFQDDENFLGNLRNEEVTHHESLISHQLLK
jgi:hypothetical protein